MELIDLSDNLSASHVIDLGEESNDDVIEICEIRDRKNDGQYDSIFKESKLLGEFIEKCFDLENTKGMIRVINRSLLPAYYSTSQNFRESEFYTSIMLKAIRKLDSDPDHKFSHVKELCDDIRRTSQKLEEKYLKQLHYPKRIKRKKKIKRHIKKKRKLNKIDDIILSDDSNGFEVPIINLDEYASYAPIPDVPVENCDTVNQKVAFIVVDIDSVAQDSESTNDVEKTENLCEENISSTQNTSSGIKSTEFGVHSTEAHISNKKDEPGLKLKEISSKPLGEQSNKDKTEDDTEISSTEISSTVHVYDYCDVDVKGFQDSDIIVLDQDEKEFVTTTLNNVETSKVNIFNKVRSIYKMSSMDVLNDDTCRKDTECTEDKDLMVIDKDYAHKLVEEPLDVENKNNKTSLIVPALTVVRNGKSIANSVGNDLVVLDENKESEVVSTNEVVNQDTKQKSNLNTISVEKEKFISKEIQNNDLIVIDDEDYSDKEGCNNNNVRISNSLPINEENKLLVPHKAIIFKGITEETLKAKIRRIEVEILECKSRIAALEEEEVNHDSIWSPYIQCEKYKALIVKLYKELCKLTGEQAVKRREVRLKANNRRSQLCVQKLEDLINSNIGHDGLPHFPDFQDALQCVRAANREGQLGWNRSEVLREANALFTYCGRALQESRKRREWRDMLSLVKCELVEDPADNDPELMARLQANKQAAVKKERDLIDKYSEMSYLPPGTESTNENDSHYSDSENETENEVEQETSSNQDTAKNITSQNCHNAVTDQYTHDKYKAMEVISQNLVKSILNKTNANLNSPTETQGVEKYTFKTVTYGSHVRKRCTPIKLDDKNDSRALLSVTKTPEAATNKDPKNILNHNFNLITKVVLNRIPLPNIGAKNIVCTDLEYVKKEDTNKTDSDNTTNLISEVKKEPVDIQTELDKLGNNFTATVIDIEDPFLVVEISSDSEDEDDEFPRYDSLPL